MNFTMVLALIGGVGCLVIALIQLYCGYWWYAFMYAVIGASSLVSLWRQHRAKIKLEQPLHHPPGISGPA